MQPENQQTNSVPSVPAPVNFADGQQVAEAQTQPVQFVSGNQPPQQLPTDTNQPQNPEKPADKFKGLVPKLVKMLLVVFVVIGALFFINLFAPKAIQIIKENNPLSSPTPEPTPTAVPVVNYPPSKYANDPEVLQIEDQLELLENGLNAVEFTNDTLRPPLLDWEISFSE